MTLNKVNHDEIERFIDLGLNHDAEPLVLLVANPYQTFHFQRAFLHFKADEFDTMHTQIDKCIPKLSAAGFKEAEAALVSLKRVIENHRALENKISHFALLTILRKLFRFIPKKWQHPVRKFVYLPLRELMGVPLGK